MFTSKCLLCVHLDDCEGLNLVLVYINWEMSYASYHSMLCKAFDDGSSSILFLNYSFDGQGSSIVGPSGT